MLTPPVHWKLLLDVPYEFSVEPGYAHAKHAHDIRISQGDVSGVWQDPNTGLMMLEPSFIRNDFYTNSACWVPLTSWIYSSNWWQEVYRAPHPNVAVQVAKFYTTLNYSNSNTIGLVNTYGIAFTTLASSLATDTMTPVLCSNFNLSQDEGFVWFYNAITDEMHRFQNWFSLTWGGITLHFSATGTVRCYRHPGEDNTVAPTLFDQFEICTPGDIFNKDGYFVIVPVPGFGLNIYHSLSAQRMGAVQSSAMAGVTRGHLIPLPTVDTGSGYRLLPSSPITVCVASDLRLTGHLFGFHRIRYTSGGTVRENVFDPKFKPTTAPDTTNGTLVPTVQKMAATVGASTVLRNALDTANWAAGVDRQARQKVTLTTSDSKYTPFLLGTYTKWAPVFSLRDTEPFSPDKLHHLEITDSDDGRFEGMATVRIDGMIGRAAVERGDMTFTLLKSFDGGYTWERMPHAGGFARVKGDVAVQWLNGLPSYTCQLQLADMWARFAEVHQLEDTAFDGLAVGEVINVILQCSGLGQVASVPAELSSTRLPEIPKDQNWRFGSREGDSGDEVIRSVLQLVRKQYHEWLLLFDWPTNTWTVELKPRDTSAEGTWYLSPFSREASLAFQTICFSEAHFATAPPEANLIQPYGATDTDPKKGEKVPGTPIYNIPSLNDPTSPDYLGRVIMATPKFAPLKDVDGVFGINKMGRMVYDAACHRRLMATCVGHDYVDDLVPGTRVIIRSQTDSGAVYDWQTMWLKRRTVLYNFEAEGEIKPNVTYHLDSQWEGDLK
jgi:hypothetical protein